MSCIIAVMALSLPGVVSIEEKMEAEGSPSPQARELFLSYLENALESFENNRKTGPIQIDPDKSRPLAMRKMGLGNFVSYGKDGWLIYVFAHPRDGETMARLARNPDFLFKRDDRLIDGNGVCLKLPEDAAAAIPDGSRVIVERRR